MKRSPHILAFLVLLWFTAVPPCGGAGEAFTVTNGVLQVTPLVQISFEVATNTTYTLYTTEKLGGNWVLHPWCDHAKFHEPRTMKIWDNPEVNSKYFKLVIEHGTTTAKDFFGPPPPDPTPTTNSFSLPPIPGQTQGETP